MISNDESIGRRLADTFFGRHGRQRRRWYPLPSSNATKTKSDHSPRSNIVRLSHNLQFTQPGRARSALRARVLLLHQLEFCMVKFCVGQMSRGQLGRARRLLPRLLSRLGLLSPMGPILIVISKYRRASPRASPAGTKTYDKGEVEKLVHNSQAEMKKI